MGPTLIGCARFVDVLTDGHCLDLDLPVGAWDWSGPCPAGRCEMGSHLAVNDVLGSHGGWICFDRATADAAVGCGDDPRVLLSSCLEASPCWMGGGVYWPICAAACSSGPRSWDLDDGC
ncbi:hypothetical protein ACLOJK_018617 [Asimina triloba]